MKISVNQALLLLLEKYKDNKIASNELEKLFFLGVSSDDDADLIKKWLGNKALEKYEIVYTAKKISEDPVRRYFETHLAYETVHSSLHTVPIETLKKHCDLLLKILPENGIARIAHVLRGEMKESDNLLTKEYTDAINKLKSDLNPLNKTSNPYYKNFTSEEKEKMLLFTMISFLSVQNAEANKTVLPLKLYGTGIFSPEQRGKILKKDPEREKIETSNEESPNLQRQKASLKKDSNKITSHHFGLMKSYMPTPKNDITYSEQGFTFTKPSDQADFNEQAVWTVDNFKRLVHPFSNAISGTMLVMLNVTKYLTTHHGLEFSDINQIKNFLKCYVSFMIYNSGGHSFHEFLATLALPEIKDAFKDIKDFDTLTQYNIFLEENRESFAEALKATINYNNTLLQKELMQEELLSKTPKI